MPKDENPEKPQKPQFAFGQEEEAKVTAWLKEHWTGPKTCPISGHNAWSIAPNLVQLMVLPPEGGLAIGGTVFPSVLLICNGCGYTMTFNAVRMGLATPPGGAEDG